MADYCDAGLVDLLLKLLMIVYIFFRYSGELREIGVHIDEAANFIWENVRFTS